MMFGIIGLLLFFYLFYNFYWKRKNLPAGPIPLPILGNLFSFRNNQIEHALSRWHKQYGDIMTVWLGTLPVVIVHDAPTIFETFLKDGEVYSGRHFTKGFEFVRGGYTGVILTDGELWKEHRKFLIQVLRDFGLGKNLMQERILTETTSLVTDIKNDLKKGIKVISIQKEIDRAVGSIINVLTFGYRFGRDKIEEFHTNKENMRKLFQHGSSILWHMMEDHVDVMQYLPIFSSVAKQVKEDTSAIAKFYLDQVETHKKKINFKTDDEATDYVEAFLRQQHKLEKSGQKDHTFTDNQLFGMIFDLWFAGQETTTITLGWLCLYLIRDQEIQKKVHEELDRVIGSDRVITLDDKIELNYLNAVIAETQRFGNLFTLNLLHKTTKDVEIHEYHIPKNTVITYQISSVLFDERYFKDPYTFNPDRFIDKNGKFFTPPELIPFGVGKRACLGEGLARMELFLFASNIFNQLRLKPVYGMIPSDYRKAQGAVSCLPYKTEIELRPTPLPILGNIFSFRNNQIEHALSRWHKKYGDIMTVWLGTLPVITVHDPPTIYETFLKDGEAYTGRYFTKGFELVRGGCTGVILTDGELWREHRRFTLHVLRDFGLGKNLMQERVLTEVTSLISDIKDDLKNGGKVLSIQDEIDRAVGSIINALTFGYRFGRDKKEEFQQNKRNIQKLLEHGSNIVWMIMQHHINIMQHLPFFSSVAKTVKEDSDGIAKFYLDQIEIHKRKLNFQTEDEPTDYVEAFLRQQHKLEKSSQKEHTFTDNQLFGMIFDLWLAGQETTSTTLGWLCLYLIRNPEIQKKVHEELDRVIGNDRIITLDDKNELNYINAVIAEAQRCCNLVPFNVMHKTTKDVEIHGYRIPKGAIITHQVSSVLTDERYFKDPYTFNPERFLDKHGKFFSPPEFIPFGVGKRACLGEGLARMELFLFTANIFNQIRLKPAYGMIPNDYRKVQSTIVCLPYKTEIELRH